jgi:hypothetical protein
MLVAGLETTNARKSIKARGSQRFLIVVTSHLQAFLLIQNPFTIYPKVIYYT